MRKLLLGLMLVCGQVFADDGITGTYAVKLQTIMSSCDDLPLMRKTNEQWIINLGGDGYIISVIGNQNSQLQYEAGYDNNMLYGRYAPKDMFGGSHGFVDVQMGFKSLKQAGGIKAVVHTGEGKDCVAVSTFDAKKLN